MAKDVALHPTEDVQNSRDRELGHAIHQTRDNTGRCREAVSLEFARNVGGQVPIHLLLHSMTERGKIYPCEQRVSNTHDGYFLWLPNLQNIGADKGPVGPCRCDGSDLLHSILFLCRIILDIRCLFGRGFLSSCLVLGYLHRLLGRLRYFSAKPSHWRAHFYRNTVRHSVGFVMSVLASRLLAGILCCNLKNYSVKKGRPSSLYLTRFSHPRPMKPWHGP